MSDERMMWAKHFAEREMKKYDALPAEQRAFWQEHSHLFGGNYGSFEEAQAKLEKQRKYYIRHNYGDDHPGLTP